MRGKTRNENAYLTVWLALCLTLILSLFLVLIDGARRNGGRLETECVTDIGLQSILAEYHRELVKQYNIFAIDASYGTGVCSKGNTESHLKAYLEKNLSVEDIFLSQFLYRDFFGLELRKAELPEVLLLTDEKGAVFRKRAVCALGNDVGLGLLKDIREWMQVIEVNGLDNGDTEKEKHDLDAEVESYNGTYIEEQKDVWVPFHVDNPTAALEEKRRLGILKMVTEGEEQLSQRALASEHLILKRMQQGTFNQGNMKLAEQSGLEEMAERFLFQEYLLKYMGRYGCEQEEDVLKYQVEYLVSGKNSDIENLRSVAGRLCAVREAANALYLLSNNEKRMEAQLIAEVASALLWVPELAPVLEAAILLGWAFAESVYDVKSLLNGGRIPLLKNDESWHYSLSSALWGELQEETREGSGLSYTDYLRIFMMLTDLETLTGRAMNMVEADIRHTPGNAAFRLDGCIVQAAADIQIDSAYGYCYSIKRHAGYD